MKSHKKIVVIGGGTGSFMMLSGLKKYCANLTALVSMADDGGSTGILRDELGVLPPGDVRQCLIALARSPKMRQLFDYRFAEGDLKGHSFGNLFLTAVEKMTNNFSEAVDLASEVLNIAGKVVPVTLDNVKLVVLREGGRSIVGEHNIEQHRLQGGQPSLRLEPAARLNPLAKVAIQEADLIVIAPGSLYSSIGAALATHGMAEALRASSAKKAYVCNLTTKPGHSDGFQVHDFANLIEHFMGDGNHLDYVLYNDSKPSDTLLKQYAQEGSQWVAFDETALAEARYQPVGGRFVSDKPWHSTTKVDLLPRTLIRHDSDAVAKRLINL